MVFAARETLAWPAPRRRRGDRGERGPARCALQLPAGVLGLLLLGLLLAARAPRPAAAQCVVSSVSATCLSTTRVYAGDYVAYAKGAMSQTSNCQSGQRSSAAGTGSAPCLEDNGDTMDSSWCSLCALFAGDSFSYAVELPSTGAYNVSVRYATVSAGVQMTVAAGGANATFASPSTNSWFTWAFSTSSPLVFQAGVTTMTVTVGGSGNPNINFFDLCQVADAAAVSSPAPPLPLPLPSPSPAPLSAAVVPLAGFDSSGRVYLPVPEVLLGAPAAYAAGGYELLWSQDGGPAIANASGSTGARLRLPGALLKPGNFSFSLSIRDPASGEARLTAFAFSSSYLPVLKARLQAGAEYGPFLERWVASASFRADVAAAVAAAFGVPPARVGGLAFSPGLSIAANITSTSAEEAAALPSLPAAFDPAALSAALGGAPASLASAAVVDGTVPGEPRAQILPLPPFGLGPGGAIELKGGGATLDGRFLVGGFDGALSSFQWTLRPAPSSGSRRTLLQSGPCPFAAPAPGASLAAPLLSLTLLGSGPCAISLRVTDVRGVASQVGATLSIVAVPPGAANVPPRISMPPALQVAPGAGNSTVVPLSANVTDDDGVVVSATWRQVGGNTARGLAGRMGPGSTAATALLEGYGQWVFRLTVSDDAGAEASAEVTVTIRDPSRLPQVFTPVRDGVSPEDAERAARVVTALVASFIALSVLASLFSGASAMLLGPGSVGKGDPSAVPVSHSSSPQQSVSVMQRLATLAHIASAGVPASYRTFASGLGVFMLRFRGPGFDASGVYKPPAAAPQSTAAPLPGAQYPAVSTSPALAYAAVLEPAAVAGVPGAARRSLLAAALDLPADYRAPAGRVLLAAQGARDSKGPASGEDYVADFQSSTFYMLVGLAGVTVVQLVLYLWFVALKRKYARLQKQAAVPCGQLAVYRFCFIATVVAAGQIIASSPRPWRELAAAYFAVSCAATLGIALFFVWRIRLQRLAKFEVGMPFWSTLLGRNRNIENLLTDRERRKLKAERRQASLNMAAKGEARGEVEEEELEDEEEELAWRGRSCASRALGAVLIALKRLDTALCRGRWLVNDKEHGDRAAAFREGYGIAWESCVDTRFMFVMDAIDMAKALVSAAFLGVYAFDPEVVLDASMFQRNALIQLGVFIGLDVVTLFILIVFRPYICRWVGLLQTLLGAQNLACLLVILHGELRPDSGADSGALLLYLALFAVGLLMVDQVISGVLQIRTIVSTVRKIARRASALLAAPRGKASASDPDGKEEKPKKPAPAAAGEKQKQRPAGRRGRAGDSSDPEEAVVLFLEGEEPLAARRRRGGAGGGGGGLEPSDLSASLRVSHAPGSLGLDLAVEACVMEGGVEHRAARRGRAPPSAAAGAGRAEWVRDECLWALAEAVRALPLPEPPRGRGSAPSPWTPYAYEPGRRRRRRRRAAPRGRRGACAGRLAAAAGQRGCSWTPASASPSPARLARRRRRRRRPRRAPGRGAAELDLDLDRDVGSSVVDVHL
eukprot:tig00020904_g15245.t1